MYIRDCICICIWNVLCVYVYKLSMRVHTYTRVCATAFEFVYMRDCSCIYIWNVLCVYVYKLSMRVHTYIYTYIYIYINIYIYTRVCVCTRHLEDKAQSHTYKYIYIHTYMHSVFCVALGKYLHPCCKHNISQRTILSIQLNGLRDDQLKNSCIFGSEFADGCEGLHSLLPSFLDTIMHRYGV